MSTASNVTLVLFDVISLLFCRFSLALCTFPTEGKYSFPNDPRSRAAIIRLLFVLLTFNSSFKSGVGVAFSEDGLT